MRRALTLVGSATGTQVSVPVQITGTTTPPPLPPTKSGSTTDGKVKPQKPKAGHKVKLKVTVNGADGATATGQVEIQVKGGNQDLDPGERRGRGQPGPVREAGKKVKVTITYLGSDKLLESSDTVTFRVRAG